jgi:tetraacyldisaccharide 4'-kinase
VRHQVRPVDIGLRARVETCLQRHWWRARPSVLARCLQPLSWLYAALAAAARRLTKPQAAPVPVLVVGNLVVGGAGKTPSVLAAVRLLQAAGHRPAVLSRGYGRQSHAARRVTDGDTAAEVGDEPLLIHRRSGVPVWVGADRAALAWQACAQDPAIDVLVCDDGLQHHRLARSVNLVVFDERGTGNGLLLPAGPLRQALHVAGPVPTRVLYNAAVPSTPLPGALALRSISRAWPLQAWWAQDAGAAVALTRLQGRPLLAAAGMAAPEKFFSMLQSAGLHITRLPLPDHHDFAIPPWPAGTADVLVTEKDAVKLQPGATGGHSPATRVWVVPLDFQLPEALSHDLLQLLFHKPAPP